MAESLDTVTPGGAPHLPVLRDRCVELLAPALQRERAVFVDCTLGAGGHSAAVLEACPGARLVGLDRDPHALALADERLRGMADRVHLVHTVYDGFDAALDELGIGEVDAVLFDLGVSSMQLDDVDRGFSYARDAPLDMRMDQTVGATAADLVASLSEIELRDLFYRFGDEKLAPRYASRIVRERELAPITSTGRLVDILQAATPAAKRDAGHPAKRVFQALRIAVNGELDALAAALPQALDRLRVGGRIAIESYQSLEDRFVKRELQDRASSTAPQHLPVDPPEHAPELRLLTRGAERAGEAEAARNPRAIPVRLRAAERIHIRHPERHITAASPNRAHTHTTPRSTER